MVSKKVIPDPLSLPWTGAFARSSVTTKSLILGAITGLSLLAAGSGTALAARPAFDPHPAELDNVLQIGKRVNRWIKVLQLDMPATASGERHDPEHPVYENPTVILSSYHQALAHLPGSVAGILSSADPLPAEPPSGVSEAYLTQLLEPFVSCYNGAVRWNAAYTDDPAHSDNPQLYAQNQRDIRPYLRLSRDRAQMRADLGRWSELDSRRRAEILEELRSAKFLATEKSIPWGAPIDIALPVPSSATLGIASAIGDAGSGSSISPQTAARIASDLDRFVRDSARNYRALFQVAYPNPAISTSIDEGGVHVLRVPYYGIDEAVSRWMQEQIDRAWKFDDLRIVLTRSEQDSPTVLHLVEQSGTVTHADATVVGDKMYFNTMVMDAQFDASSRYAQVGFRHEFGHVLGLPDCYIEVWDSSARSFVYYSVDPENRMCALDGGTQEIHRKALLDAYFGDR